MVAAAGSTQASRDENNFAWQSWATSSQELRSGLRGQTGIAASCSLFEGLADMMELRLSCLSNVPLTDMVVFLVDDE